MGQFTRERVNAASDRLVRSIESKQSSIAARAVHLSWCNELIVVIAFTVFKMCIYFCFIMNLRKNVIRALKNVHCYSVCSGCSVVVDAANVFAAGINSNANHRDATTA